MGKRAAKATSDPGPKAKAKSGPASADDPAAVMAAVAAGGASAAASSQALSINGKMWAKHVANIRLFRDHAVADDAVQMQPRASYGQAYDAAQALASLKKHGQHMCQINLLWLDPTWNATPQIPINQGAVDKIQEHWFAKPAGLENQQITVGVLQQEVDSGSLPAFGCWRRLSAEESVIAWFAAAAKAAERVRDGGNDDELQAWLGHCLSCPVLIKVVQDLSEMEWASQQLREDLTQLTYLQRTPLQRIFDVMQKKEAMGANYSVEALIELYADKLKLSAKSEKITKAHSRVFFSFCFFERNSPITYFYYQHSALKRACFIMRLLRRICHACFPMHGARFAQPANPTGDS